MTLIRITIAVCRIIHGATSFLLVMALTLTRNTFEATFLEAETECCMQLNIK